MGHSSSAFDPKRTCDVFASVIVSVQRVESSFVSVAKRHMVMKAGKTAQTWQTAVGLGPAPVSMFHRVERYPVANERDVDELRDGRE
jgi:hypothetical protein